MSQSNTTNTSALGQQEQQTLSLPSLMSFYDSTKLSIECNTNALMNLRMTMSNLEGNLRHLKSLLSTIDCAILSQSQSVTVPGSQPSDSTLARPIVHESERDAEDPGPSHIPNFYCRITLPDHRQIRGPIRHSKPEAKVAAQEYALQVSSVAQEIQTPSAGRGAQYSSYYKPVPFTALHMLVLTALQCRASLVEAAAAGELEAILGEEAAGAATVLGRIGAAGARLGARIRPALGVVQRGIGGAKGASALIPGGLLYAAGTGAFNSEQQTKDEFGDTWGSAEPMLRAIEWRDMMRKKGYVVTGTLQNPILSQHPVQVSHQSGVIGDLVAPLPPGPTRGPLTGAKRTGTIKPSLVVGPTPSRGPLPHNPPSILKKAKPAPSVSPSNSEMHAMNGNNGSKKKVPVRKGTRKRSRSIKRENPKKRERSRRRERKPKSAGVKYVNKEASVAHTFEKDLDAPWVRMPVSLGGNGMVREYCWMIKSVDFSVSPTLTNAIFEMNPLAFLNNSAVISTTYAPAAVARTADPAVAPVFAGVSYYNWANDSNLSQILSSGSALTTTSVRCLGAFMSVTHRCDGMAREPAVWIGHRTPKSSSISDGKMIPVTTTSAINGVDTPNGLIEGSRLSRSTSHTNTITWFPTSVEQLSVNAVIADATPTSYMATSTPLLVMNNCPTTCVADVMCGMWIEFPITDLMIASGIQSAVTSKVNYADVFAMLKNRNRISTNIPGTGLHYDISSSGIHSEFMAKAAAMEREIKRRALEQERAAVIKIRQAERLALEDVMTELKMECKERLDDEKHNAECYGCHSIIEHAGLCSACDVAIKQVRNTRDFNGVTSVESTPDHVTRQLDALKYKLTSRVPPVKDLTRFGIEPHPGPGRSRRLSCTHRAVNLAWYERNYNSDISPSKRARGTRLEVGDDIIDFDGPRGTEYVNHGDYPCSLPCCLVDFVVVPQINGNQGSWTNSDDVFPSYASHSQQAPFLDAQGNSVGDLEIVEFYPTVADTYYMTADMCWHCQYELASVSRKVLVMHDADKYHLLDVERRCYSCASKTLCKLWQYMLRSHVYTRYISHVLETMPVPLRAIEDSEREESSDDDVEEDHEVRAQINGNNGSWTNTDDLAAPNTSLGLFTSSPEASDMSDVDEYENKHNHDYGAPSGDDSDISDTSSARLSWADQVRQFIRVPIAPKHEVRSTTCKIHGITVFDTCHLCTSKQTAIDNEEVANAITEIERGPSAQRTVKPQREYNPISSEPTKRPPKPKRATPVINKNVSEKEARGKPEKNTLPPKSKAKVKFSKTISNAVERHKAQQYEKVSVAPSRVPDDVAPKPAASYSESLEENIKVVDLEDKLDTSGSSYISLVRARGNVVNIKNRDVVAHTETLIVPQEWRRTVDVHGNLSFSGGTISHTIQVPVGLVDNLCTYLMSFKSLRGEDGPKIFNMLQGYTIRILRTLQIQTPDPAHTEMLCAVELPKYAWNKIYQSHQVADPFNKGYVAGDCHLVPSSLNLIACDSYVPLSYDDPGFGEEWRQNVSSKWELSTVTYRKPFLGRVWSALKSLWRKGVYNRQSHRRYELYQGVKLCDEESLLRASQGESLVTLVKNRRKQLLLGRGFFPKQSWSLYVSELRRNRSIASNTCVDLFTRQLEPYPKIIDSPPPPYEPTPEQQAQHEFFRDLYETTYVVEYDAVIPSQINGNNGSATNTDDLEAGFFCKYSHKFIRHDVAGVKPPMKDRAFYNYPIDAVKNKEDTTLPQNQCALFVTHDYRPVCYANTRENEEATMMHRVVVATPVPDSSMIRNFLAYAKTNFRNIMNNKIKRIRSVEFEEYIERSNASSAVKLTIRRAKAELDLLGVDEDSNLSRQQLKLWTTRGMFLKQENLPYRTPYGLKQKTARAIMTAPPWFIALVGPWIMALQDHWKRVWHKSNWCCFVSGVSSRDTAVLIDQMWQLVEDDVGTFDSSVSSPLCEFEVWVAQQFGCPQAIVQLMSANCDTKGYSYHGAKFFYPGGRKSGDPYTSLFNSMLNAFMHIFIISTHTGWSFTELKANVRMLVAGDDNVMAINFDYAIPFVSDMLKLGFNSEALYRSSIHEVEFCSCRVYYDDEGPFFGPMPGKVLSKFGFVNNPPVDVTRESMLRGIALGLKATCYYLPPVRTVVDRVLALTTKHVAYAGRSTLHKSEEWHMNFNHPCIKESGDVEIYISLHDTYGWNPIVNREFEHTVANLSLDSILDDPYFRMLCDRDTSGPSVWAA